MPAYGFKAELLVELINAGFATTSIERMVAGGGSGRRPCPRVGSYRAEDVLTPLVRAALKQYLRFIETDDWPAMAQGRANLRRIPPGLTDAMTALLSFVPAGPGQQLTQERAVIAVEQALDARRHRIVLSQATIAPIQWLVIFLLDVLILLTIAFVHLNRVQQLSST
jgi:hypothetical protein